MRWLMVVCVVVIGLVIIGLGEDTRQLRSEVTELRRVQKYLKEEQRLIKKETIACILRSLETLEEAREMVNSVFAERTFIPVSKDVLIAIDTGGEEEEGMLVEIQDE